MRELRRRGRQFVTGFLDARAKELAGEAGRGGRPSPLEDRRLQDIDGFLRLFGTQIFRDGGG
jgi:hypothetical protein